jgi:hypothetical protein
MKLYFVHSVAPRREHIDDQIIAAETPEQAYQLWSGFYGFPWPCSMNLIPPVGDVARVEKWNPPIRFSEEP